MKKLLLLFSSFALFSLIFIGCQSAEEITSPVDNLSKPAAPVLQWDKPIAVNTAAGESKDVTLVAGQKQPCGHITIYSDGSYLFITYYTNAGWTITETHLMIVKNPSDFIVTNTGNPKVGQFPYGNSGLSVNQSITYKVPYPNDVLPGNTVYVGAHAVVENCVDDPSTAVLCPNFSPDSMTPKFHSSGDKGYTVTAVFENQGTFNGWCVDNTRYISSGVTRPVNFICSYSDVPQCTTFLEKPENLDLVNWIINNRQSSWSVNTIQAAIWELINPSGKIDDWSSGGWVHDPVLREEIVALAKEKGEGFVPSCDQKVLVLVYKLKVDKDTGAITDDPCTTSKQVIAIEVPVKCQTECSSETAWAFNLPITDGTSASFPGANWFRYFGYKVK